MSDNDIPRVSITQPTSKNGGTAGNLMCSTGIEYEAMRVAVLEMGQMRQFWSEDKDEFPACKSSDMVTPDKAYFKYQAEAGNDMEPVCDECGEYVKGKFEPSCPNATWPDPEDGKKRKSPLCKEVHCYTMVDVATGMPFKLDLKGLSIKPSRGLRSGLRWQNEPWSITFDLFAEKDAKSGQWFVAKFSGHRPSTPDEKAMFAELVEKLSGDDAPF